VKEMPKTLSKFQVQSIIAFLFIANVCVLIGIPVVLIGILNIAPATSYVLAIFADLCIHYLIGSGLDQL
jgi:hypothetical protein